MKVLVTGVAGFIGSHTAKRLLEDGFEVVGIDNINDYYSQAIKRRNIEPFLANPNFKFCEGDICDLPFLEKIFQEEKIAKVCHLAARAGVRPSIADPFLYEKVNILGTLNLLEMARQHAIENFVFASSSSVYGESNKTPFSEDQPTDQPISPYAATKKANENFAYTYSHLYGLPCVGLRFFTVYGPSGRPDMAPFLFTKAIFAGETIKQFGDGTSRRDYTYIDDIVAGVVAALDLKTKFEIINLGCGNPVILKDFIALMGKLLGKQVNIQVLPMQQGDVSQTFADISKARRLLGYAPKTSFEEGMKVFVEWFLANRQYYEK